MVYSHLTAVWARPRSLSPSLSLALLPPLSDCHSCSSSINGVFDVAVAESLNFTNTPYSGSGVCHCQKKNWSITVVSESVFGLGSAHYAKRTFAFFKQPCECVHTTGVGWVLRHKRKQCGCLIWTTKYHCNYSDKYCNWYLDWYMINTHSFPSAEAKSKGSVTKSDKSLLTNIKFWM